MLNNVIMLMQRMYENNLIVLKNSWRYTRFFQ